LGQLDKSKSSLILITGHVILTPEHRERMIALGAEHSARSRDEPGCLAHNCHIDVENPDRLMFVEEWESVDAVRTHFAVPASAAFVAEMCALSSQPPAIRIYAAEDITAKLMGA
jgi:quinol monooxygenase YgiN